ncbi:MAG: HEAT repeat domain-containing protein, partial [Candidatus Latescibacteria bacterium]|nr:HEAT repeat domain-containing protein [Candidatus Latescibacterota bacterium]
MRPHKLPGIRGAFPLLCCLLFGGLILSGCAGKSAEEWVQDLKNEDEAVRRRAALELLKKTKEEAVPPLIRAVRTGDEQLQYLSVQLLGKMRDPETKALFLELLDSPNEHIRGAVTEALGNLKTPEGTDPLLRCLKDASPVVRRKASMSLWDIEDPRVMPALVAAMSDSVPEVRRNALVALAKIWPTLTQPAPKDSLLSAIERALDDEAAMVRYVAVQLAGSMRDVPSVPALIRRLRDENVSVREKAARSL